MNMNKFFGPGLLVVAAIAVVGFGVFSNETNTVANTSATSQLANSSEVQVNQALSNETENNARFNTINSRDDRFDTTASIPETPEDEGVYIEVIDGCDYNFQNDCLNVRSGPGSDFAIVDRYRTGMVLRVVETAKSEDGMDWYRVSFDNQKLYYPERVESEQWVAAPYVRQFIEEKPVTEWEDGAKQTDKKIVIDRSDQTLTAYQGDAEFMKVVVSTGEELSPTRVGEFEVFKKMPTRYMQGPIPGSGLTDEYDLPGVPWDLYFTYDGAVIHGAYWHNEFGSRESHGCVNLRPEDAKKLYDWAVLGTKVVVQD
jgi:hypothetical protein